MAAIFPFRALRYRPDRFRLGDVLTQPYDKITPAMQARYYDASPYNLVRVILGRAEPGDNGENVYTRAAQELAAWRRDGILALDPEPSMYAYAQRFAIPAATSAARINQNFIERRGFVALGQIEDYANGVVFRHEQTLAAPKADRLSLLRTTRTHCEQLFMIYSDPAGQVDAMLAQHRDPDVNVTDEYGVEHRLWRVADPFTVSGVQRAMADKKLIIADGHHRYETALAYRNERREDALTSLSEATSAITGMGTGSFVWKNEWTAFERVMMTFVNMDAPGLVILPTHRVVYGLPQFESGEFVRRAREFFAFEQIAGAPEGRQLLESLARVDAGDSPASTQARPIELIAATQYGAWRLRLNPEAAASVLA